jgi:hypothetical protein
MTVYPGFGGQSFITAMLDKVRQASEWRKAGGHDFQIEVDGGINISTAAESIRAGANLLVAGKSLAQTFFANGATRLHPEEWTTGAAAGATAVLMVQRGWASTADALAHVGEVQALLENGMDKELTDLFVARNKAATEMQDQWDKVQLQHDKVMDLRSDPRYTSNNPELKNQAIAEWTQRWAAGSTQKLKYDAKADYIAAQKRANPNWTPEDIPKWNSDFVAKGGDAAFG